jgi:hypothetical protein
VRGEDMAERERVLAEIAEVYSLAAQTNEIRRQPNGPRHTRCRISRAVTASTIRPSWPVSGCAALRSARLRSGSPSIEPPRPTGTPPARRDRDYPVAPDTRST